MHPTNLPEVITREYVESQIIREEYHLWPDSTLTSCALYSHGNLLATGESATAATTTFDAEKGRKYAREDAFNALWGMLGVILKRQIYERGLANES